MVNDNITTLKDNLTESSYIPGQCNIGPDEIKKRQRIGYIGLVLMIIFIISAETLDFPQNVKLLLFAPTVYALSGFLQARQRFCFFFGFIGIFSITGKRARIKDAEQKRKDVQRSLYLVGQILFGSAIITMAYYILSDA